MKTTITTTRTKAVLAALGTGSVLAKPHLVLSLASTVLIFGAVAFVGAFLVDRYGNLPGGDRRCA